MGFSFSYTTNSVSDEDAFKVIDKASRCPVNHDLLQQPCCQSCARLAAAQSNARTHPAGFSDRCCISIPIWPCVMQAASDVRWLRTGQSHRIGAHACQAQLKPRRSSMPGTAAGTQL